MHPPYGYRHDMGEHIVAIYVCVYFVNVVIHSKRTDISHVPCAGKEQTTMSSGQQGVSLSYPPSLFSRFLGEQYICLRRRLA